MGVQFKKTQQVKPEKGVTGLRNRSSRRDLREGEAWGPETGKRTDRKGQTAAAPRKFCRTEGALRQKLNTQKGTQKKQPGKGRGQGETKQKHYSVRQGKAARYGATRVSCSGGRGVPPKNEDGKRGEETDQKEGGLGVVGTSEKKKTM